MSMIGGSNLGRFAAGLATTVVGLMISSGLGGWVPSADARQPAATAKQAPALATTPTAQSGPSNGTASNGTPPPAPAPLPPIQGAVPITTPTGAIKPAFDRPQAAIDTPLDPRQAQVFALFSTHCASCHQKGRLTIAAPAGSLANILDLPEIAKSPHLVVKGQPDQSRIYQVLLDRHRPFDTGESKWPDADEIARVRVWIDELRSPNQACARSPVTSNEIATIIDGAVAASGAANGLEMRFVSLVPLWNACASDWEMEAYRQGVAKVLNSLSWGSQPVAPVSIDAQRAILAFKLSDLGWVDEHWSILLRAQPAGVTVDVSDQLTMATANGRLLRGDWLASVALSSPFYGELLGLAPTLEEMTRLLGVNRQNETAARRSLRAGMRTSLVTRGPRVIERHAVDSRRLWIAYDFSDGVGDRDPFERPLSGIRGASQFRADGQRIMFTLPNGFIGFGLFDAEGRRIDRLPPRLEADAFHSAGVTTTAASCSSCHASGVKPFTDAVRAHFSSDKFVAAREVKDQALALYPLQSDWNRVIDEDGFVFRRALIQAGVDPDATLHGLELGQALSQRYVRPIDYPTASGESGLTPEAFDKALSAVGEQDPSKVQRLRQGLLSREEINQVFAAFPSSQKSAAADLAGLAVPLAPSTIGKAVSLALWTNQATYRSGDLMTIYAQPSAPCHLTLISVNGQGKATVLFPSEFDPENLVQSGMPLSLPNASAPYQFRLKDKGRETIVGSCQTGGKLPAGVEPDYEHQRFTVLGSYENFVRTSFSLDTQAQMRAAERNRTSKPVGAREPSTKDQASKDAKLDGKPDFIARASVQITIE